MTVDTTFEYDGLCPTALAQGVEVQGDPAITSTYEGRNYAFVAQDAKDAFDADPAGILAAINR
ncbi:MAG: hypothetical protein AAFY28_20190 [Actinomycetota bacterium]